MKKLIYILLLLLIVSCEEIINEVDISDEIVILIAPQEATLTDNSVNFSWQSIEGATEYNLKIAKPNFVLTEQIVLDTLVSTTNFTKELISGDYAWSVQAFNSAYNSTVVPIADFSISTSEDFSNNTIVLNSPEDNLITNQANQILTWDAIEGAELYRIQYWNIDDTATVEEVSVTTNQITVNFTEFEGNILWQVRAEDATQNTLYTSRNILVDITVPNTPTLLTPTDNETVTETDVNFTWQRNELAGSVESDKLFIYNDINLSDLVQENDVENNSFTATLETGNTYYWVMQSFDAAGNQSAISSTFSFTIN